MNLPPPEERFKQNLPVLIDLIREGIDIANHKGAGMISADMIQVAGSFLMSMDSKELIDKFIHYSYPHWEKIREKDEAFFINDASAIFSDLPLGRVEAFRNLFLSRDKEGNYYIDDEFKEDLWANFKALVKISIKYLHRSGNQDYPLQELAQRWGIKLES